jgi:hypothetical protein
MIADKLEQLAEEALAAKEEDPQPSNTRLETIKAQSRNSPVGLGFLRESG